MIQMHRLSQEVLEAAQSLAVAASPLESQNGGGLHEKLAARFGTADTTLPLWERLTTGASLQDEQGWAIPSAFIGESPCLLSFEPRLDNTVLEFARGADLEIVLAECSGFVFYVCDSAMTYVMCFNDHDYVIAVGSAKPWLEQRTAPDTQS